MPPEARRGILRELFHDAGLWLAAGLLGAALAMMLWPRQASAQQAAGDQVAGPPPPACPFGQVWIQISLGQTVLLSRCIAQAELERAGYRTVASEGRAGELVCRTLIIRAR